MLDISIKIILDIKYIPRVHNGKAWSTHWQNVNVSKTYNLKKGIPILNIYFNLDP